MCSHELCASNTRSRGASNTRVVTISRSDGVVTVSTLLPLPIAFLPSSALELVQVLVQPVVALLPELPVSFGPLGDVPERPRLEPGGPPSPWPAARDPPRPRDHFPVPRDRRPRHLDTTCKRSDGRLPPR